MPNIYAAMDIFSWPAVNEAIGLVFLEAGAAGLPVIAGHTDGVASIVRQGQTGVVVPTGDSGAFAAGLRELITNTQMRTQLGNRAEKHVREHHSIESASSKLNTLLRSLTNKEAA